MRFFKLFLGLLFCPFALFYLSFGLLLLRFWYQTRNLEYYYFTYPYIAVAATFFAFAVATVIAIYYGAWRRSSRIGLLLVPVALFVLILELHFPALMPHSIGSGYDMTYFSHVAFVCDEWYASHNSYPASDADLGRAMGLSQQRIDSQYRHADQPVPYQIMVENSASGPRTDNVSARPGVLYYSVSPDFQEFWITMTALADDAPGTATLLKSTRHDTTGWIIHGVAGHSRTLFDLKKSKDRIH